MLYSVNLLVKMLGFYVFPGKNAVFDECPRENAVFMYLLVKMLYSMNLLVKENAGFLCISW